jgi:hypothetical protein
MWGNPVGAWCCGDGRGYVSESWTAVGFNFLEADLNEAARAADAFACLGASVGNYPLEQRMTPEVR